MLCTFVISAVELDCDSSRPNQVHKKAIEVDAHLRVKGAPVGEVYAIGDASTVSAFVDFATEGVAHVILW